MDRTLDNGFEINPTGLVEEIDYGTPAAKSDKTVTLTVDGFRISVPEGTSIMRAAKEAGITVPKLCATDMLNSFGSCRMCLVEIEGRNGTPASCTTPVAEGMAVKTQTPRLKALRKGVMELYISDHPLDCLTCGANGDCELQDMAGAWACARCATAMPARTISTRSRTSRTPISSTIPRSASSALAACGPARRCRAPSR